MSPDHWIHRSNCLLTFCTWMPISWTSDFLFQTCSLHSSLHLVNWQHSSIAQAFNLELILDSSLSHLFQPIGKFCGLHFQNISRAQILLTVSTTTSQMQTHHHLSCGDFLGLLICLPAFYHRVHHHVSSLSPISHNYNVSCKKINGVWSVVFTILSLVARTLSGT